MGYPVVSHWDTSMVPHWDTAMVPQWSPLQQDTAIVKLPKSVACSIHSTRVFQYVATIACTAVLALPPLGVPGTLTLWWRVLGTESYGD